MTFPYTPDIYTKENQGWNIHIGLFMAIQLIPWIIAAYIPEVLDGYGWLTMANVRVLLLAWYEQRREGKDRKAKCPLCQAGPVSNI
jgi:hypothetical protein